MELAVVRPRGTVVTRIGAYAFGVCFFGLIPVVLVMPFGPPPGHPAYLIAWAIGAVIAVFAMRRVVRRTIDSNYLTLTEDRIVLGREGQASVNLEDVVDTVPVLTQNRFLQPPVVQVNPEQFTTVLLRLRDGSRLPLSARRNVTGFEQFLINLFERVRPTIRIQGELSEADKAVLGPRNANKLHPPG